MSLSRRSFLERGGRLGFGAAVLPMLPGAVSATAPQAVKRAAANEAIRLAWIGVGGRGQFLMDRAMEHKAAAIVAVCDVNERNLASAAQKVRDGQGNQPRQVKDFRRVLEDDAIDAVVVATPHHWHAPIAVRALQAGKHLYLEKPASHVFREGRLIAEAARRSGRVFQHGTQMRNSEVTAEAGKVLASGVLGPIRMAKAWGVEPRNSREAVPDTEPPAELDYDLWLGPAPQRPFNPMRWRDWNSFRDYGNGEIGGDGVHDIDMARWGLGVETHPVRVVAHGNRTHLTGAGDFPDNMLVTYEYADGRVLVYENRNFAPYKMHGWDNGNVFYGTKGYMVFSRRGYFQTYLGENEEPVPGVRGGAGDQRNVHHFLDCVYHGKPSNADALVAHLSCGIVHLGEIAYRTGRALRFDADAEKIVGDVEADAMLSKAYRGGWGLEV